MRRLFPALSFCSLLAILFAGCLDLGGGSWEASGSRDYFEIEFAEDEPYLEAADDFFRAIAAEEFGKAYDLMSPWASKDVNPNQFMPETTQDDPVRTDITREEFIQKMQELVERSGKFHSIDTMYVESTDANILAGKTQDKLDAIDVVYAIGMMSPQVPNDIRRASVRGTLLLEINSADAEKFAAAEGYSSAEEMIEDGYGPYVKLKVVLVEEEGKLQVAYFELIPPSMLD